MQLTLSFKLFLTFHKTYDIYHFMKRTSRLEVLFSLNQFKTPFYSDCKTVNGILSSCWAILLVVLLPSRTLMQFKFEEVTQEPLSDSDLALSGLHSLGSQLNRCHLVSLPPWHTSVAKILHYSENIHFGFSLLFFSNLEQQFKHSAV